MMTLFAIFDWVNAVQSTGNVNELTGDLLVGAFINALKNNTDESIFRALGIWS